MVYLGEYRAFANKGCNGLGRPERETTRVIFDGFLRNSTAGAEAGAGERRHFRQCSKPGTFKPDAMAIVLTEGPASNTDSQSSYGSNGGVRLGRVDVSTRFRTVRLICFICCNDRLHIGCPENKTQSLLA